ncbi:TRAP transporter large permease [Pusillimonas sp. ANT_WB101]|uniref:TRAP transporter large permease n=1 Tax=Pusillimonas sp. ANT_WB101 TaxID=2597356 RepID=UPI0011F0054D|nr:TRAP transporter large permease [Pusillimonas sp. ANT_WB101]KAA0892631.1 TRAP transporter large permease [Pusillimonas sp. ANT_WB101]
MELPSSGLLAFVLFFLFLLANFPISISLGLAGVVAFAIYDLAPFQTLPMIFSGAISSFTLLAIPLFVVAGAMLSKTGVASRLITLAQVIVGELPGGLAITVVVAGAFLGALSGSNIAAIAALGFLIGAMHKVGYPIGFATATVAAGCTFGVVIPPSINLILYGVIANTSIPKLFAAGIGPGITLVGVLSIYIYLVAKHRRYPIVPVERSWPIFWRTLREASWGLLAPVIVLGGIYSGVFTATEAAAVMVVYVFLVDRFVYREMKWREYPYLMLESGITTGVVMLILAMASILSYVLMIDGTASLIRDWLVLVSGGSRVIMLLLVNFILVFAGMFLDPVSAIYLLVPLFLPAVQAVGVDTIHFGAIMTVNLSMAHITPPVGLALYLASQIAGIPFTTAARAAVPFVICEVIVLMLVTFIPIISLGFVYLIT